MKKLTLLLCLFLLFGWIMALAQAPYGVGDNINEGGTLSRSIRGGRTGYDWGIAGSPARGPLSSALRARSRRHGHGVPRLR